MSTNTLFWQLNQIFHRFICFFHYRNETNMPNSCIYFHYMTWLSIFLWNWTSDTTNINCFIVFLINWLCWLENQSGDISSKFIVISISYKKNMLEFTNYVGLFTLFVKHLITYANTASLSMFENWEHYPVRILQD